MVECQHTMEDGLPIVGILAIAALAIAALTWHFSRSRSVLEQWADEQGFEILSSEYRNFARGPFFWTSSQGQTVYFVTVRDGGGRVRSGWVRCGGWFSGLMTDKAEVRWEDEA